MKELGLAYGTLASAVDQPAKAAFMSQLTAKYRTVDQLNTAWGTSFASWDELGKPYIATRTPNDAMKADMATFVTAFAEKWFSIVSSTLKRHDPNHMFLGCRFAGLYNGTPEEIAAAAKYCDVVSFNAYNLGESPADWQARFHSIDKPILIGEFQFGAFDHGLFGGGMEPRATQQDRAENYERYIKNAFGMPDVVGAHWFQYLDEPPTGRTIDGENFGIGFVSIADTPYSELISAARAANAHVYQLHAASSTAPAR